MRHMLVLAIGNTLLSDDGVGQRVLRHLQTSGALPQGARALDGGTLSFNLAPVIESCSALLVLDAANLGLRPGSTRCLDGDAMDEVLQRPGRSVHEVGLADLLDIARLTGRLPARRALIGIQPAKVDWGEDLSPEVSLAVPRAARIAADLLAAWSSEPHLPPISQPMQVMAR